jgi:hypothetical protein
MKFSNENKYSQTQRVITDSKKMTCIVVRFLSGNSPASEVYMPTFRNTLSVPSSPAGGLVYTRLPTYEDGTECSETSAYKLQTPWNCLKESVNKT